MSDVVIQVDSLWKKYRLGVLGTGTLRHDFNRWLHRLAGRPDPYSKVGEAQQSEVRSQKSAPTSDLRPLTSGPATSAGADLRPLSSDLSISSSLRDDEMWALRDVSFEVKQGEILGIIGRNGAGKSTLLKILSRVTAPTSGEVRVKGRIASLLEVGTGFHPELTGRENIFLNGTILGMTKPEIKKKLDEIVAFSEVEKFIDTPVKRYSSGMYVRLAFAVAAHLEPEILIVDEVLAVGDTQFQNKCVGKMKDVATHGRTVLFVSHNMAAVRALCSSAVLLRGGRIAVSGKTDDVIQDYLYAATLRGGEAVFQAACKSPLEFSALRVINARGRIQPEIDACDSFRIQLDYQVATLLDSIEIAIRIYSDGEIPVTTVISTDGLPGRAPMRLVAGKYRAEVEVPGNFLMPGSYSLSPSAFQFNRQVFDHKERALRFRVNETGTSVAKYGHHKEIGVVLNSFPWTNGEHESRD